MSNECDHAWKPTDTLDGKPEFRRWKQVTDDPVAHFMCINCSARTWFTKSQYEYGEKTNG